MAQSWKTDHIHLKRNQKGDDDLVLVGIEGDGIF